MAAAAAVSITLHAAILLLILPLLDHVHRPARRPVDYIYVTFESSPGRPGPAPTGDQSMPARKPALTPAAPPRATPVQRVIKRHAQRRGELTHKASAPEPAATSAPATEQSYRESVASFAGRAGRPPQQPSGSGAEGHGDSAIPGNLVEQPPILISSVTPDYPEDARDRGIAGAVLLEIVIDRSGKVEHEIRVIESIPILDQAAIAAVRRWRFTPGRERGIPVRVLLQVPLRFTLQANEE